MDVLPGEGELRDRFDDDVGAARGRVANRDARGKQREINELAAVDGQLFDLLFIDNGTDHSASRFRQLADVLHFHLRDHLAGREREIQAAGSPNVEVNFLRNLLEAGLVRGYGVISGGQQGNLIVADRTGIGFATQASGRVNRGDRRLRNGGAAGVVDASLHRHGHNLRH